LGAVLAVFAQQVFSLYEPLVSERWQQLPVSVAALIGAVGGLFHLGIWALAFVYPVAVERARSRAEEAVRLRSEADRLRTQEELARLRAQLEPHFLLNTLNAIAGLVTQDPRRARRLLGCLGDLLRDSVSAAGAHQTLGEELEWLRRYAEILESRHEHIRFVWDVPEALRGHRVPRLLLQPLVENAIKHGALRRSQGGWVAIRAERSASASGAGAWLQCVVEDNGPGIADQPTRAGAVGLHTVRRRLVLEHPDATLLLESSSEGTRAIQRIPCTSHEEALAAAQPSAVVTARDAAPGGAVA
jgi:LytS/YehU family sensor histidine kinase